MRLRFWRRREDVFDRLLRTVEQMPESDITAAVLMRRSGKTHHTMHGLGLVTVETCFICRDETSPR